MSTTNAIVERLWSSRSGRCSAGSTSQWRMRSAEPAAVAERRSARVTAPRCRRVPDSADDRVHDEPERDTPAEHGGEPPPGPDA